jgi:hypothetical protein
MDARELYAQVSKQIPKAKPTHDLRTRRSTAFGILLGGGSQEACANRLVEAKPLQYTNRVFVAGFREPWEFAPETVLRMLNVWSEVEGRHVHIQKEAQITPDQMHWIAERLVADTEITALVMSTAAYHLPRCVLTFVKTWAKQGDKRKLALRLLPTRNFKPTSLSTTNQTVQGELERIALYQEKGDVATPDEFFDFIRRNMT